MRQRWIFHAQVIDKMLAHPLLGPLLKQPSVSLGSKNLYAATGIFEAETRPNLQVISDAGSTLLPPGRIGLSQVCIGELAPDSKSILTVNDKSLAAPLRVILRYGGDMAT